MSRSSRPSDASDLPQGRVLFVHPPYVHASALSGDTPFVPDDTPFLPLGPLYAAEVLEAAGHVAPVFFDCQLHDLRELDAREDYDGFAVTAMGSQNVAPAAQVVALLRERYHDRSVYVGGQGVERMLPEEFERVFPGAYQLRREALTAMPGYYDACLERQIERIEDRDLKTYLSNELTLLFGQGCVFGCRFCGAQIRQREQFYDTVSNLEVLMRQARRFGIDRLDMYCTSLDFFQQATHGNRAVLERKLEELIELQECHGVSLRLRALTRADSYIAAMRSEGMLDLVKRAGFFKFGVGADGAASEALMRAMHKGNADLEADLLKTFDHAQSVGLVPEILYVFGIPSDTPDTLVATRNLCVGLLERFPTSEYRGFPAKNEIPGNLNWQRAQWKASRSYDELLSDPRLFLNLGFETLANQTSHPDPASRVLVNRYAVEMSYIAHDLDRVQSFLTVPVHFGPGAELMDEASFERFREIVVRYAPREARELTLASLPESRDTLNALIPKDT